MSQGRPSAAVEEVNVGSVAPPPLSFHVDFQPLWVCQMNPSKPNEILWEIDDVWEEAMGGITQLRN
jgi:hypothetical protein